MMYVSSLKILFLCSAVYSLASAFRTPDYDEGDECRTKNNSIGECRNFKNCPSALRTPKNRIRRNFSRCGFSDLDIIICCPEKSDSDKIQPSQRACLEYSRSMPPVISVSYNIMNGDEVERGEFPHMVALVYSTDDTLTFDCGGSILSNQYVMTAAHCVEKAERNRPFMVRVGSVKLNESGTDYFIREFHIHPEYRSSKSYNDIAVLKLTRRIEFNDWVRPACLANETDDSGFVAMATGWGTTSNTMIARSSTLMKADLRTVTNSECNKIYNPGMRDRRISEGIKMSQICAHNKDRMSDTCQGDSGGPLQIFDGSTGFYKIVGITSAGRTCGSRYPGIYTKVSSYLEWIERIVWGDAHR